MASVTPATPEQTTDQVARVVAALAAGVLGSDHGPAVPERVLATLGLLPSRRTATSWSMRCACSARRWARWR